MVVSSPDCHHERKTAVRQESSGPCLPEHSHCSRKDVTSRMASSQLVTERDSPLGMVSTSGVEVTVIRTPHGRRSSIRRTQTAVLGAREFFTAECPAQPDGRDAYHPAFASSSCSGRRASRQVSDHSPAARGFSVTPASLATRPPLMLLRARGYSRTPCWPLAITGMSRPRHLAGRSVPLAGTMLTRPTSGSAVTAE